MKRILDPSSGSASLALATLIRLAGPGDVISVPSDDLKRLGETAARRMGVNVEFVVETRSEPEATP